MLHKTSALHSAHAAEHIAVIYEHYVGIYILMSRMFLKTHAHMFKIVHGINDVFVCVGYRTCILSDNDRPAGVCEKMIRIHTRANRFVINNSCVAHIYCLTCMCVTCTSSKIAAFHIQLNMFAPPKQSFLYICK